MDKQQRERMHLAVIHFEVLPNPRLILLRFNGGSL